jgi:hypothetical protein
MDFQSVDSAPATQSIELKADDVKGDKLVPLRYACSCTHTHTHDTHAMRTTRTRNLDSSLTALRLCYCRFVKFQNVSSITIFVESNQGGEPTTVIQRLRFIGQAQSATNMNEFKRVRQSHHPLQASATHTSTHDDR